MQVILDDYPWAAAVATDLMNSAPGVWRGVDKLPDVTAVREFLDLRAMRDLPGVAEEDDTPPVGERDVAAVHRLRDRVRALVDHPELDALVGGAGALTDGVGSVTLLDHEAGRRRWALGARADAPVADRLGLICGVGILGVVQTLGVERFRLCSAETCSGAFIDASRPGRRRYCMPELCGNRVNVAAHRARRAGVDGGRG